MAGPPRVLHVGCGGSPLPSWLAGYEETRVDIDPRWFPDVIASAAELGIVSGRYDALLCAHTLEHLTRSDVGRALREFYRVLRPGGFAAIFVPDLEGVLPTQDVLYVSPAGPITGLDLIYGFSPLSSEMVPMQHRTGFVQSTLEAAMKDAGFERVVVNRMSCYNLMAAGMRCA